MTNYLHMSFCHKQDLGIDLVRQSFREGKDELDASLPLAYATEMYHEPLCTVYTVHLTSCNSNTKDFICSR